MRRSRASPTALRSGSFLPGEVTEVDAPASDIVVGVVVVVAVVVGTIIEISESGVSLVHVAAVAYIETTPRQTATLVDR